MIALGDEVVHTFAFAWRWSDLSHSLRAAGWFLLSASQSDNSDGQDVLQPQPGEPLSCKSGPVAVCCRHNRGGWSWGLEVGKPDSFLPQSSGGLRGRFTSLLPELPVYW